MKCENAGPLSVFFLRHVPSFFLMFDLFAFCNNAHSTIFHRHVILFAFSLHTCLLSFGVHIFLHFHQFVLFQIRYILTSPQNTSLGYMY